MEFRRVLFRSISEGRLGTFKDVSSEQFDVVAIHFIRITAAGRPNRTTLPLQTATGSKMRRLFSRNPLPGAILDAASAFDSLLLLRISTGAASLWLISMNSLCHT